jgi:hypothetical protein
MSHMLQRLRLAPCRSDSPSPPFGIFGIGRAAGLVSPTRDFPSNGNGGKVDRGLFHDDDPVVVEADGAEVSRRGARDGRGKGDHLSSSSTSPRSALDDADFANSSDCANSPATPAQHSLIHPESHGREEAKGKKPYPASSPSGACGIVGAGSPKEDTRDSSAIVINWLFDGVTSASLSIAEAATSPRRDEGRGERGDWVTPSERVSWLPAKFRWDSLDKHETESGLRVDVGEKKGAGTGGDIDFGLFGINSEVKQRSTVTDEAHQIVTGQTRLSSAATGSVASTIKAPATTIAINSNAPPSFLTSPILSPTISTPTAALPEKTIALVQSTTSTTGLSKYTVSNFNATLADDSFPYSAFAAWRRQHTIGLGSTPVSPGTAEFGRPAISSWSTSSDTSGPFGSENPSLLDHDARRGDDRGGGWRSLRPVDNGHDLADGAGIVATAEVEGSGVHSFKSLAEATTALRERDNGLLQHQDTRSADTLVFMSETASYGGGRSGGEPPREFVPSKNIYAPAFPHRKLVSALFDSARR